MQAAKRQAAACATVSLLKGWCHTTGPPLGQHCLSSKHQNYCSQQGFWVLQSPQCPPGDATAPLVGEGSCFDTSVQETMDTCTMGRGLVVFLNRPHGREVVFRT